MSGSGSSVTLAQLRAWLQEFARVVVENEAYLTELDSAIGDADHGANMCRGMAAAAPIAADETVAAAKDLFTKVGMKLVSTVGGASGPLYGTFFLRLGAAVGDVADISPAALAVGLRAGAEGIVARGKAVLGDKTMVDVWLPALDALDAALAAGQPLTHALAEMTAAADTARDATAPLQARKGRASYLGERSVGHLDPGATSSALLIAAAARTVG
ncbi:MAG: dihydroxyacetone kinase subunit DhaL [Mycobacteriaceae bacterium]